MHLYTPRGTVLAEDETADTAVVLAPQKGEGRLTASARIHFCVVHPLLALQEHAGDSAAAARTSSTSFLRLAGCCSLLILRRFHVLHQAP